MTADGEIDVATQYNSDLFFGMAMDRKNRTGLVDVPHQGLVGAMDGLSCDPIKWMLDWNHTPVDGSRLVHECRGQKTNQPQKSASASRKMR